MKQTTVIAILGGHSEDITSLLSLPSYPLGYINQAKRIVDVYNSANAFVLPSLEDNLPNTIMEAMACGVPCIGFNVGGIPEEIEHKVNGYVAEYKNSDNLSQGIHWVLEEADYETLSHDAVRKVNQCYSQRAVAARYIEIYEKALKNKGI
jgi:glycosyltransferase involved in cell wall biosynthesis